MVSARLQRDRNQVAERAASIPLPNVSLPVLLVKRRGLPPLPLALEREQPVILRDRQPGDA
jgi:hypothetical protein